MLQAVDNSIRNVLGFGPAILISAFLLSGCLGTTETQTVVEVRTVETPRPAPIVPTVDTLQLRDVSWVIVTPENVDDVFSNLSGDLVLFAITAEGYEALSLNLSDIRAMIQQQQEIIAVYQNSYR